MYGKGKIYVHCTSYIIRVDLGVIMYSLAGSRKTVLEVGKKRTDLSVSREEYCRDGKMGQK